MERNFLPNNSELFKMKDVSTFNDVVVEPNSYVLLDIDDTVLDYGEPIDEYWIRKPIDPFYKGWYKIMSKIIPELTDIGLYSFLDSVKNNGCEIAFITHRNEAFKEITKKHIDEKGLDNIPIHFLSGNSKGNYIKENFSNRKIIFIDDSLPNIDDVMEKNVDCSCYLFKKNKKNK